MGRGLLLIVSGLVIITGMVQTSMFNRLETVPERNADYAVEQHLKNISNSLVDQAMREIAFDNEWKGSVDLDTDHMEGSGSLETYVQSSNNRPDDADLIEDSWSDYNWNQFKVMLYITAEFQGKKITTEVMLENEAFSKYSYFSNAELSTSGTPIYFFTDDELSGPVHSNGTFRMAGTPTFNGYVTSPNDWIGYTGNPNSNDPDERHGSDDPQFNGGSNFNSSLSPTPDQSQLDRIKSLADVGGFRITDPYTKLHFYTTEIAGVPRTFADFGVWNGSYYAYQETIDMSTTNGIISSTGRVDISGEITGQITIHTEDDIEIDGDLTYYNDPIDNPGSNDLLGLVSEEDVRIDQNAHTFKGSKDIDIQASIMALGDSFHVENYNWGSSRGEIRLLGGIIQNRRGPVGTFSGSGVASGFSKDYQYDERLLVDVPPAFPREEIFSIISWNEKFEK